MGLFDRIFGGAGGTTNDPVLGKLARSQDEGTWSGQATWVHGNEPFALTVFRSDGAPDAADQRLYQQLVHDYPAVVAQIQTSLSDLWNRYRANAGSAAPDFGNSLALWRSLRLQGIGLHGGEQVQLIFGFADERHPEGAFLVAVRGRQAEPLEYVE